MTDQHFPESPAVAWTNIKTVNGFHWSFTMRANTVKDIVKQIEDIEIIFIQKKWEAEEIRSSGFKKKEVEYTGKLCPIDQGKLVKPTAPNRPIKCENAKYDLQTKTSSGCAYVEWPKPNA
jgi:hypothetical protein